MTTYSEPDSGSDSDIIRRSLDDPAAFGALFDRHAAAIHRYVARRSDPGLADDLVAQTFLIAFERRAAFDPDHVPVRDLALPWLFGISTNLLARHRRSEARMLRALQRSPRDASGEPSPQDRVADRVDADRAVAGLASALRTMSRGQRDVLLLHAWADLTYEQIAEALRLPVGTVRSRLNRARAALRSRHPDPLPADVDPPGPSSLADPATTPAWRN